MARISRGVGYKWGGGGYKGGMGLTCLIPTADPTASVVVSFVKRLRPAEERVGCALLGACPRGNSAHRRCQAGERGHQNPQSYSSGSR